MDNFVTTESLSVNETAKVKVKRGRGRPRLTEEQKAVIKSKRDAGKTKRFSVGEEPNKRKKV